uniref:RNA-directed DNA polymerase, eukaryota, Reverse transcriptase zinc-binding domain protein n=1 Tax=Lactuca sativa TaxID=4236 RepID=A0A9R1WKT9_LACSA|nr:hypothetical protein LSAT_V11C100003500 [Lactuca sativa]
MALLGKWWWRFKNDRKELWKLVITTIYGCDGGFNAASRAKRKVSCWGTIANLPAILLKYQVDFKSLFIETQSNQQPSWRWSFETSGEYTMSSLRFHIDTSILPKSPQLIYSSHVVSQMKCGVISKPSGIFSLIRRYQCLTCSSRKMSPIIMGLPKSNQPSCWFIFGSFGIT